MSERPFSIPGRPSSWTGFKGYTSDVNNAPPDYLTQPSVNAVLDDDGVAMTRDGFEDTAWNLNNANKAHTAFYHKTYDITFFAGGTKVYYIDHNNSNAVVDTGLTLTTAMTTRFSEYAGDVYLTNTTDGLRRIVVGRLNGAVANGAASMTVDVDMAARLSVFSITSGNLRIGGTNEAFSAVTVSTGVLTHGTTTSQAYADNAVCIVVSDISSGREKASKVGFWKERMVLSGFGDATNADQPRASIAFSKFTVRNVLENIIDFTYGSGGSTIETVGKSGDLKNFLATEDYLYLFKENETYVVANSDVNLSTGASIPNLRSPVHGCMNEDCAADMGNGEVAFLTPNKRIIRFKIATDSGAPVVFPDESFDVPMRDLLRLLDADQTGALFTYHQGKRRLYCQVRMQSQWVTLVWDNNVRAWLPPQTGKSFKAYVERNGVAYATDMTDDTIYQIDSSRNDNGSPIECYICTGVFDVDDSMMDSVEVKGSITQPTTIYVKTPVNGGTANPKTIVGTSFSYGAGDSLGSFSLGSTTLGGDGGTGDFAEWKKNFDIYPSEANKVQLCASCIGDGHWFSLKKYTLYGRTFSESFTPMS